MNLKKLTTLIADFIKERDWEQYNSLKNVSISISVEAAELLEHFTWIDNKDSLKIFEKKQKDIKQEVADILISTLIFCAMAKIDAEKIFFEKLEEIKAKYPIDKAKGKNNKYTDFI
ncbi:TPA: nucleotide pyrophosphohydrolase [Candidatus Dependentiae bacterium]|nr:MAG: Nucleotide pyrophosphohydrolase [candidate division TM6 bacterium GW2011_GWF2_36_131]KKQ02774.1 MAG: Nucleotide pyrophosphohydrolase [candidate division TM6 bacterium GW2011_GWE2_36_25]KKQ19128.1 MAG: Nucleotide pyrophosphohydrolase [candidate division TM6 bacterium GW2011_GWA2_36_9]HBR70426.1 nucleotide pyrophosphohydrolase [Candidatus Dependentiae bacterium]HCU01137.1 nucleotide pyrophosphohydrolase [Candidatus Dependentiae bacterium]